jgi:hypothetical protein
VAKLLNDRRYYGEDLVATHESGNQVEKQIEKREDPNEIYVHCC